MRLPSQSPPVHRKTGVRSVGAGIEPSGCDVFKAIGCAGAVAACAAVCVGSVGTACVQCLAALGASGCVDCL
jgi:hypothetical protein